MARRKREEEHDNHERWLVSTLISNTLLFCFLRHVCAVPRSTRTKYLVLSDC